MLGPEAHLIELSPFVGMVTLLDELLTSACSRL